MGERVEVPQTFWDALAGKIQEDDSFRASFAVSEVKSYTRKSGEKAGQEGAKRDAYFQWLRLDALGEKIIDARGYPERWSVNWTMWDDRATKRGDPLALLFAPALGERNVYISIFMKGEDMSNGAIYAEAGRDEEHPWLKMDPEGYDIWLHRPKWDNMSQEQQEAWSALGKPDWVNMFTCLGGNPFTTQEEPEQEPVAVGVSGDDDMMEL